MKVLIFVILKIPFLSIVFLIYPIAHVESSLWEDGDGQNSEIHASDSQLLFYTNYKLILFCLSTLIVTKVGLKI